MCELFALSSNKVVGVRFTWRGFLKRGRKHRDGWGVAFYRDGTAIVIKEPLPAPNSNMAKILRDTNYVRSNVVISHVRKGTKGGKTYANTHPFRRELYGKEWVFAHNGDVSRIEELEEFKLKHYSPIGQTDSEYAFCYIMDRLRELGKGRLSDPYVVRDALETIAERIQRYGKFNFLLSNGNHIYAYMSREDELHYLFRYPPHTQIVELKDKELKDEDFKVDLGEIKSPDEKAILVATQPLTKGEKWHKFPLGRVLVFRDGEPLSVEVLSEKKREVLAFIKSQPHRVSIRQIVDSLRLSMDEVIRIVGLLVLEGWIKQDSRDRVPQNHPDATFYTKMERREEIGSRLRHLIAQFQRT